MTQPLNPRDLEADVLLWSARLPLAPAEDLDRLTRAPDDSVTRALGALTRHGWLDHLSLYSPAYAEPFVGYALRPEAIPAFAAAFRLDETEVRCYWPVGRRDLMDRLASFEVVDDVNRFLANVASDYLRSGIQVIDLRALPRTRKTAGSPWPPLMDAYGCIHHAFDLPFFVAWDRAAVPAKHRSARVSAWYEARGYGDWPTILIVCPGDAERRHWEQAIRLSAYRRDTDPLEVAFTTTNEAFGDHPTGQCWRLPGEDYAEPLSAILRSVGGPPLSLPRTRRLDLIDRGVPVQELSLSEWAARRSASSRSSVRDRVAALRFELEQGHWRLLVQLARHPYLTDHDLATTMGDEIERIVRVLADLQRHRLVGCLAQNVPVHRRRPRMLRRWFVTHAGLELLAASEGVPPLRYAEHAGLAVETSAKGRGGNRLRDLRRNYEHTLGVNAVFVRLARDATRAGHRLPHWWSESEATRQFEYQGKQYWVRPDGAGIYYCGEQRRYFLLEYDRGTMRRRDYGRKLAGVAAFFKSETAEAVYGSGLTVLVVSETDDGERRFAEAVCVAERQWSVRPPVLLTTRQHVNREQHGLLGVVWRTADDANRRIWLGESEVSP